MMSNGSFVGGGGGGGGRFFGGSVNDICYTHTSRVSQDEFEFDTVRFRIVINNADALADKMNELKKELDNLNSKLMFTWSGEGRNTFEKKYRLLSQQLGDMKEDLREIAEELKTAEQAYIQYDVDLAKAIDGKDSRF